MAGKKRYEESNPKQEILEQYKLCVEMADRISNRRQQAGAFFASINSALLVLLAATSNFNQAADHLVFLMLSSTAGTFICYFWYCLIKSYQHLNSAKFRVILELEKELATQPFGLEWQFIGKSILMNKYSPFTEFESRIPLVLLFTYGIILLYSALRFSFF